MHCLRTAGNELAEEERGNSLGEKGRSNLSNLGTNIPKHQSIVKSELRGKLALDVNELIKTS